MNDSRITTRNVGSSADSTARMRESIDRRGDNMATINLDGVAKVINVEDLMARCLGNLDFVERILTIFQTRCESDLVELEEAIKAGDLPRVQRLAHRLKGACANAGANDLSIRASELWTAANKEFTDVLAARFAQFRQEWDECAAILSGESDHAHSNVVASAT